MALEFLMFLGAWLLTYLVVSIVLHIRTRICSTIYFVNIIKDGTIDLSESNLPRMNSKGMFSIRLTPKQLKKFLNKYENYLLINESYYIQLREVNGQIETELKNYS